MKEIRKRENEREEMKRKSSNNWKNEEEMASIETTASKNERNIEK